MPISDWSDLCPHTICHEPLTGRDSYGKPTYGPVATYQGRRVYKIDRVPGGAASQGAVVLSSMTIWILGLPHISYDDHIWRDGDTVPPYPPVMNVQVFPDETSDLYTKVMLGSANT